MRPDALPHVSAMDFATMVDPERTCLCIVDVQVDFAGPDGMISRVGVDMAPIEAAIDVMEGVTAAARQGGMPLAFIRVVTRPGTDGPALKRRYARLGRPLESLALCRAGTRGADYYRLFPEPGDIELEKVLFDSFYDTDFHEQLQARGITSLVVIGLTSDCCVDQTVRGAYHRGYDVFVVSDAVSAYGPELHAAGLLVMQKNCALLVSAETARDVFANIRAQEMVS
jgi:nicotinamidase-related amidase